MEPIIDYLKRRLREAGAARWPAIASAISTDDAPISEHLLRKVAYGDRDNPRLDKVQPLLDYFHAVDSGARSLPEPKSAPEPAATEPDPQPAGVAP